MKTWRSCVKLPAMTTVDDPAIGRKAAIMCSAHGCPSYSAVQRSLAWSAMQAGSDVIPTGTEEARACVKRGDCGQHSASVRLQDFGVDAFPLHCNFPQLPSPPSSPAFRGQITKPPFPSIIRGRKPTSARTSREVWTLGALESLPARPPDKDPR